MPMGFLKRDTETNPTPISFGGSGARFSSLRNRRGVRSGQDGLVQKRLVLTVLNGGDGSFSLSIGGGKRKVNESECSAVNLDVSGPKKSKTKQSPL